MLIFRFDEYFQKARCVMVEEPATFLINRYPDVHTSKNPHQLVNHIQM